MKRFLLLLTTVAILGTANNTVRAQSVLEKIKRTKDKLSQHTDENTGKTADESGTDKSANGDAKPAVATDDNLSASAAPASFRAYQNFDFVPGDKVLFEDHFTDDQDGEFPAHWELVAGQAVVNKVKGEPAFSLTDGNYVRVKPRMKTETYLTDPFTVEYDTYAVPGTYGPIVMLQYFDKDLGSDKEAAIHVSRGEVSYGGESDFSKSLPADLSEDNFDNKWHHVAIAYKNKQLKVYVDQYRILVVPDTKASFEKVQIAGIGSEDAPIIVKNFRIASGGEMNMLGKKFTEAKIITHGINFDVDKATIRPESMGTLNMIVQVMKDNPDVKFEIDGHTDNSGSPAHNLALSQQRSDAVKDQLVKMGVDASRLKTKGFGDSKPISDNTTLEGKANNRRVEFVKM